MAGVVSFTPIAPGSHLRGFRAPQATEGNGAQSGEKRSSELKQAAAGMESLFLHELLKSMRATVPKSGLFNASKSEEQYTSMLDIFLSDHLAKKGELGIGSLVEKQLHDENGPKVSKQSADK